MAKKKKQPQRTKAASMPSLSPLPLEDRTAEVATIAWILAALMASGAETVDLAVRLYFALYPQAPESLAPLALVPGIVFFAAFIAGTVCLILTPVVYRLRRTPPPPAIAIFAVLVSLLPHTLLLLKWLRG